jgi:DNA mismatch repair protein MutS2
MATSGSPSIGDAQSVDLFSLKTLEFRGIIDLLRGFLSGSIAEPLLDALVPHTRIEIIHRDLTRAGEAREYMRESQRPRLGSLKDPRWLLEKLAVEGESCTAFEILALLELARAACDLRGLFAETAFAHLDSLTGALADFGGLVAGLEGKILPDGSVDSSASAALGRIRRSIERLRTDIQSTLEKLLTRLNQALQDDVVTIRNDRFVLPVRAEEKYRVSGIVHGTSSSGATLYVEPMETVPLNNELVELEDREFAEVQRVLAEFTDKLRARRLDLEAAAEILRHLDLAFAKAEFAREYDCCLPRFETQSGANSANDESGEFGRVGDRSARPQPTVLLQSNTGRDLALEDVRHPLLEKALRRQGRKPVPLSLELRNPKTLVIVSGPNTGGKTVALKTVGIAALMAQAGLPVAASEARLPLFERVLADIGDQQSIQENLSTFSAHVRNIQSMVRAADQNTLVLLDEIGSSTDPDEGAALAVAILDHFRERGSMTLATTHQSRLKAYAAETAEAVNAAMEFDEATLEPTYRLLVGLPGKSSGLDIAQRLGMEPAIVAKARSLLDPADAEVAALVASLHEQKARLEEDLAGLREQRQRFEAEHAALKSKFENERRAKLKELDKRLEETLREYQGRWERSVAEVRAGLEGPSSKAVKRLERQIPAMKREAQEEWNAQVLEALGEPEASGVGSQAQPQAAPTIGDRVHVSNLSTPGTVTSVLKDGRLEVELGRLRMHVHPDEVKVLAPARAGAQPSASRPPHSERVRAAARLTTESPDHAEEADYKSLAEINVIGTTAEEAREQVDKFLDQAFLAGHPRVRVIHGHGKGILMRTLHEMFAGHPHVEKFYAAAPREGGTGATVVELRV